MALNRFQRFFVLLLLLIVEAYRNKENKSEREGKAHTTKNTMNLHTKKVNARCQGIFENESRLF